MSTLRLDQVRKSFAGHRVVDGISVEISNGELVALLGPSGSGKTTLLRVIAGFEDADSGQVFIDGEDVTHMSALQRRCAMVFQHYALFPHMTVAENVGYGLERERLPRDQHDARVAEALAMVDLAGSQSRNVTSLSGGQQQRVALARALAPRPRLLLLDEPLSNLDPSLRERTRRELRELIERVKITTVLVTHEQEEAFDLADRIAVLHDGKLQQIGAPAELYSRPATPFVAGFVGRATTLAGVIAKQDDGTTGVNAAGHFWTVATNGAVGTPVMLVLRPESLGFADGSSLTGKIVSSRFAGAVTYHGVELDTGSVIEVSSPSSSSRIPHPASPIPGTAVALEQTGVGIHCFPSGGS